MNRAELQQKILSVIKEQKTLPDLIPPETKLSELGIDSLDALNILFALEESFGITIPDEQARNVRTVDDMVTMIQGLLP